MPAEVQRLEVAMRELLALLSDPESTGLDSAWERCQQAEAQLTNYLNSQPELSAPEEKELREGMEALVRLNAIARQTIARTQDSLANRLLKTKLNSEQMKGYSMVNAAPGGSCNMAG